MPFLKMNGVIMRGLNQLNEPIIDRHYSLPLVNNMRTQQMIYISNSSACGGCPNH